MGLFKSCLSMFMYIVIASPTRTRGSRCDPRSRAQPGTAQSTCRECSNVDSRIARKLADGGLHCRFFGVYLVALDIPQLTLPRLPRIHTQPDAARRALTSSSPPGSLRIPKMMCRSCIPLYGLLLSGTPGASSRRWPDPAHYCKNYADEIGCRDQGHVKGVRRYS